MKLTKIFGIVLSLHLGVAGMLLFQPGCQTLKRDSEPEASPEMTVIKEKQEERARILIGQNDEDSAVVQSGTDEFNADTIRSRRYLPARPAEPLIPETSGEAESALSDIEPMEDALSFNQDKVDIVVPDAKPLKFDLPVVNQPSGDDSRDVYFVQKGDSLWKISRKFGTTVEALMDENGLHKNSVLDVNQKLYLPSGANSSNSSYVEPSTSFVSSSPVVSSGDQYSVSKGDTLSRIARMYGVSVSSLKSANSLSSDRIYVGQKLVIPAGGSSGGYSAPSKGSSSPDPVSYKPSGNGSVYVVQKGDTLGTIAKMHGFTINELARMNNLADPNRLRVGQRLTVSGSQSSAASASGSSMIDDISTSTFTPKVSKPAPTPVKIEDEPLFDPDLKLDLNKKDIINDNFFEQDLDIPVVDVIKSDDSQ